MFIASANRRVLGYLGRALSLELTAFQQYSTQARIVATWGLTEAAERLRAEADEEREHTERIIARMLALGVAPNASQLRPVRLGANLHALLLENQAFEQELVGLYEEACRYCTELGDYDNRMFFEGLLKEERRHAGELGEWLEELTTPPESLRGGGATF